MSASRNTSGWFCVGNEHFLLSAILLNFSMTDILTCHSRSTCDSVSGRKVLFSLIVRPVFDESKCLQLV